MSDCGIFQRIAKVAGTQDLRRINPLKFFKEFSSEIEVLQRHILMLVPDYELPEISKEFVFDIANQPLAKSTFELLDLESTRCLIVGYFSQKSFPKFDNLHDGFSFSGPQFEVQKEKENLDGKSEENQSSHKTIKITLFKVPFRASKMSTVF